jgi:hypothetical protein
LPVMAIMFLTAESPSFALSFAAPFVSFTLIRLSSKKTIQSAYSLRTSTSAWSLRMFTVPQLLPWYNFFPCVPPQKNEDWAIGDHRTLCEPLPFLSFYIYLTIFNETCYVRHAIGGCSKAVNLWFPSVSNNQTAGT